MVAGLGGAARQGCWPGGAGKEDVCRAGAGEPVGLGEAVGLGEVGAWGEERSWHYHMDGLGAQGACGRGGMGCGVIPYSKTLVLEYIYSVRCDSTCQKAERVWHAGLWAQVEHFLAHQMVPVRFGDVPASMPVDRLKLSYPCPTGLLPVGMRCGNAGILYPLPHITMFFVNR